MECRVTSKPYLGTVVIKETDWQVAFAVCEQIPEFDPPYLQSKWRDRLEGKDFLCLVAFESDAAIGCKVGYPEDGYFYSWVGGVLPGFRKRGVARSLADEMERILRIRGFSVLRMKTQHRFAAMLTFAQGNGFELIEEQHNDGGPHVKIVLEKKL